MKPAAVEAKKQSPMVHMVPSDFHVGDRVGDWRGLARSMTFFKIAFNGKSPAVFTKLRGIFLAE